MSYFYLELDTRPPANPTLLINGGAAYTGKREVQIAVGTADYQAGSRDVQMMKLWGDVDNGADALVQTTEAASAWQTFDPEYVVRLSNVSGRKTINARLKDDVCNETVTFCDFIDLDLNSPVVTVTQAIDKGRVSKTAPCDAATFGWQSSRAFVRYEIRVVPNVGSPQQAGTVIGTGHGSINVIGVGSFQASTTILSTIKGADLEVASPGDTRKVIKAFVRDSNGVWSS